MNWNDLNKDNRFLGAVGTAAQIGVDAANLAQTKNIDDVYNYYKGINPMYDTSSAAGFMDSAAQRPDIKRFTAEDFGKNTFSENLSSISNMATNAATAGAKFGGLKGAVIGGALGATAGIVGAAVNSANANKKEREARSLAEYANNTINSRILAGIPVVNNNTYMNDLYSYFKCGGKLRRFSDGGELTDAYNVIGNGNTHELNPYGGVQQGVDSQGIPNLVEEGEVVWDNNNTKYVFSNNPKMTVPKVNSKIKSEDLSKNDKILKKYEGLTFAQAAQKIMDKNRDDNNIDKDTLNDFLSVLANTQEGLKFEKAKKEMKKTVERMSPEELSAFSNVMAQQEAPMMRNGGFIGNKFAIGGPFEPTMMDILFSPDWEKGYASDTKATSPAGTDNERAKLLNIFRTILPELANDDARFNRTYGDYSGIKYSDPNTFRYTDDEDVVYDLFNPEGKNKGYSDYYVDSNVWKWLSSAEGKKFTDAYWADKSLSPNYYATNSTAPTLENLIGKFATQNGYDSFKSNYKKGKLDGKRTAGAFDTNYSDMHKFIQAAMHAMNMQGYAPSGNGNGIPSATIPVNTNNNPELNIDIDLAREINKPEGTYEDKELALKNDPTWMRWMAPIGSALLTAANIAHRPNYSFLDAVQGSESVKGRYMPIDYKPIGDFMKFRPIDVNKEENRINADALSTARSIAELSNGNSPSRKMALLNNEYNAQKAIGDAYFNAENTNWGRYKDVKDYNKDTAKTNLSAALDVARTNANNFNAFQLSKNNHDFDIAKLKTEMYRDYLNSSLAGAENIFDNLATMGENNYDSNSIKRLIESGALGAFSDNQLERWGLKRIR